MRRVARCGARGKFVFCICNDCVLKKKGGDKLEGEGFVFCIICQHCECKTLSCIYLILRQNLGGV